MDNETHRFRSFAERYIVARAEHFKPGHEKEDGWDAILQAKTLYKSIEKVGNGLANEKATLNAQVSDDQSEQSYNRRGLPSAYRGKP